LLTAFSTILAQEPKSGLAQSRHLFRTDGPLTEASGLPASQIARDFLAGSAVSLGIGPQDLDGTYAAKEYLTSHNGVTHFVYRQQFYGVDVFNAEWVVNVSRDGRVINSGGQLFPRPTGAVLPDLNNSFSAARAAARFINPEVGENFAPFLAESASAGRVRFHASTMGGELEGRLVWFGVQGALYPAWAFFVTDPGTQRSYEAIIDAASNAPLARYNRSAAQGPAPRAMVFTGQSPQPNPAPGSKLSGPPPFVQRQMVSLSGDPKASPRGWVSGNQTAGNNTVAGENLAGVRFSTAPDVATAVNGEFNFPLQLGADAPNPMNYGNAATTNLFYWVNRAHDWFYDIGFDEPAGNFQQVNYTGKGLGGDPVYAYAHYGAQSAVQAQLDNAFFSWRTTQDGGPAMIAMFLSTGLNYLNQLTGDQFTDGSYDSEVILHEYTHGVSGRLARRAYDTFQGAAMGEAWSDFFALEFLLPEGAPVDGAYPVGEYFEQLWGVGIRSRPYSTNTEINPLTFANLGQVYVFPEVHADGEIWFQAMWEMRANLIRQFGEKEGRRRTRLLVIDGMKLSIPAASMVDMRDAILLADRTDFSGASQQQIWAAFAKRGLGALALAWDPDSVYVSSSFEVPSNSGKLKFYDPSNFLGEASRVILSDLNNTGNTARVQLTTSSGDLEDLVLDRFGSVFAGIIPSSSSGSVVKNDKVLQTIPRDYVSAYYVDQDTGSGARLIDATIPVTPGFFTVQTAGVPYQFARETAIGLRASIFAARRADLPFSFPFYGKTYGSVWIYSNGMIAFERPTFAGCTDIYTLPAYNAIAPLWTLFVTNGFAQPGENVYVSQQTPDSFTVRWAGETLGSNPGAGPLGLPIEPINVAATLFNDGRVIFQYGSGNKNLSGGPRISGCAIPAPTVGMGAGRGSYFQIGFPHHGRSTLENAPALIWDPPTGHSSIPTGVIESPKAGDTVKGVVTLRGAAWDEKTFLSRVDLLVDGVARRTVPVGLARPDLCRDITAFACPGIGFNLNVNSSALGLTPGAHTLQLRVTNSRGAVADVPESPMTVTLEAGQNRVPTGKLEAPLDGADVSEDLEVRGWAHAPDLVVTGVDILIDGVTYAPGVYGLNRPDICTASPTNPSNCPRVGFFGLIDTLTGYPPLPNGAHQLQVRVRDETGRYTLIPETPLTINVKNEKIVPPVVALSAPDNNARLSGRVTVSGYAYGRNGATVRSVGIRVDGVTYAATPTNKPRPDACAALANPPAACPNIGFDFVLDTTKFRNGPHTLGILAADDSGGLTIGPTVNVDGINIFIEN
jgi:hypothetical protein